MATVWERVQEGTRQVADFQARLILSLLYLLFVVPIGLLARMAGDPLATGGGSGPHSFWRSRRSGTDSLRSARRQS